MSLVRGADGEPLYFVSHVQDITESKLRALEAERFRVSHPLRTPLTPREREVLRHLADGLTTAQAATRLGVGGETVATHVRRAMAKLNASNRTQAVAVALRHDLLAA